MERNTTKRKAKSTVGKKSLPIWVYAAAAVVIIVIVAAAAVLFNQGTNDGISSTAYPKEISVADAFSRRMEGAFMLDVREISEWEAGHIPDATLIPLSELSNRLKDIPTDREVVVVCRSGNRSAQARDYLLKAGYTTVTSMAGGMNNWQSEGLPVETGR